MNISIVKWLVSLGPAKQLNAVFLLIIMVLGTVIIKREERGEKVSDVGEKKYELLSIKYDSLLISFNKFILEGDSECKEKLEAKDREYIDLLKETIADGKEMKGRVNRVEKEADKVLRQTKSKLNRDSL